MGQSNSTTEGARATDTEIQSGVTLSQDLQADIIRDFESQALQDEWNRFGKSVLQRRHDRAQSTRELMEAAAERHRDNSSERRLQALDSGIEEMEASFVDGTQSLDYDTNKLLERYSLLVSSKKQVDENNLESKPLPCLGPRAHWIDCQKKYAMDSRPCNFYMEALEECVHRTITGVSETGK